MKRRPSASAGWTLIEIVVMLVVAAIIFPAIILPFVEGARNLNEPVIRGTLAFLAQGEMEKNIIPFAYDEINEWSDQPIAGFAGYESSCDIIWVAEGEFDTEDDEDTGFMRITVTVTHGAESLSLVTIKTNWTEQNP